MDFCLIVFISCWLLPLESDCPKPLRENPAWRICGKEGEQILLEPARPKQFQKQKWKISIRIRPGLGPAPYPARGRSFRKPSESVVEHRVQGFGIPGAFIHAAAQRKIERRILVCYHRQKFLHRFPGELKPPLLIERADVLLGFPHEILLVKTYRERDPLPGYIYRDLNILLLFHRASGVLASVIPSAGKCTGRFRESIRQSCVGF